MLKEIAIFIGIFIISIAIYFFYSPSKSGMASFPTNINFGFVLGLIGFSIVLVFMTIPGRGKKKEKGSMTMQEIASKLDGPIKLFEYLNKDFAYRLEGASGVEREKIEEKSGHLSEIVKYLKDARDRFKEGEYGLYELKVATAITKELPYVNTSRGKKVNINVYMNAVLAKISNLYNVSKLKGHELEVVAR